MNIFEMLIVNIICSLITDIAHTLYSLFSQTLPINQWMVWEIFLMINELVLISYSYILKTNEVWKVSHINVKTYTFKVYVYWIFYITIIFLMTVLIYQELIVV